jgi:hypothetical protein
MTSVEIYSRAGADKAFAPSSVGAAIADHSARLAALEAVHPGASPLTLNNLVPRPARSAATAPVLGFITDGFLGAAPRFAAHALGAAPVVSAQASAGWAAGAPQNFSAPNRIDAVLDAHPVALVVVGSFEDAAASPPSASDKIAQSIKALVERVRNRAPACPIIVVGPQPTSEYLMYAGSAHQNAKAVKAGVEAAGGAGNGVHFVDWLGVASSPAVKWDPATSPGRAFGTGEVICYEGVNYRVSETTWTPRNTPDHADPYLAHLAPSAPVERASVVLEGLGALGKPSATGTRALWLATNEKALTSGAGGEDAYGVELAGRVVEGLTSLREWIIGQGPVVVGPYVAPPSPPARPAIPGAVADLRATKWGVKWGALSTAALSNVLASAPAAPFSLALPVRRSGDTVDDRFVVSTPNKIVPKAGGTGPQINQSTIAALKAVEDANGTIATLGEALALLKTPPTPAPIRKPIVLECMDTSTDNTAQYFNYDETMMKYLLAVDARAPETIVIATGPNLNAARAKAKADPALNAFRRLVVKPAGPWTTDDIKAIKDADAIACRPADSAKPEVLAAIKTHPSAPGLWFAGMVTAEDVRAARAAARSAALAIEGWLADGPAAAAEIATRTQPEQP